MSYLKLLASLACDHSHDAIGFPYELSETYRRQDANLNYPEETDMINNHSYSPLPTLSGSTGAPGRIQPLPPVSRGSSRANFDVGSPYARPSTREDAYTTGAGYCTDPGYPSATPSIRDDPYSSGTGVSGNESPREGSYSRGAAYGYARLSDREDPCIPPRPEDPRMDPRRLDFGYSPARRDPVLRGSSATDIGAGYADTRRDPVLRGSSATDIGAGYADTPPYTSGPPLFSGSSATNLDAGVLRLGRKPQG